MAATTTRLLPAAAAAALLRTGRPTLVSACRRTPRSTPFACFHTAPVAAAATTKHGWQGGAGAAPGPPRRLFFSSEAGVGGGSGDGNENGAAATAAAGVAAAAGGIGSSLRFKGIVDGRLMVPEEFAGKAVLVVNTASLCGLTPQLKELELVYQRFRKEGFLVLGVPSNDFGGQEPWEEDKIKEFYSKDFGVTFPLTSKTAVVGPEAHPLYSGVVAEFGPDVGPQWNFHKLLVGADGNLAGVFGSNFSPLEPDVTDAIEEALPKKRDPA